MSGPKINPSIPNRFNPNNTPNTVINGCTSPNFFNMVNRSTLSILPMIMIPYKARPIAFPDCPFASRKSAAGRYTTIVPKIGIMVETAVSIPRKIGLSKPKNQ
ncbi:hypothetical protein D3C73_1239540 [compost metagenome]